jgi:hypothetical protein
VITGEGGAGSLVITQLSSLREARIAAGRRHGGGGHCMVIPPLTESVWPVM